MTMAEAVMDGVTTVDMGDEVEVAAHVATLEAVDADPAARFAEVYEAAEETVGVGGARAGVQLALMTRW